MKNAIKKEWGTPTSNVQRFEPQEYCASCYATLLKQSATGVYYDWRDKGTCNYSDEYFYNGSCKNNTTLSAGPFTVEAYLLIHEGKTITGEVSNADTKSYANGFSIKLNTGSVLKYTFSSIGSFDIKIIDGKVYTKSSNAS